jgi:F-type H+-transporting ATPase subunit delta
LTISISAKRYAQAVLELALEQQKQERCQQDLRNITSELENKKIIALLENPSLSLSVKEGLLKERLGEITPLSLNLMLLLIRKSRLRRMGDISRQYDLLLYTFRGVSRASITTAIPLENAFQQTVVRRLEEMTGRKISISSYLDPSITGGIKVKIGDTLLDGSIQGRLASLKKYLMEKDN